MPNHVHLFFRTAEPNLSRGMQYLLSGYANWFNTRHQRPGHLFQGRFKGELIEDERYFWNVSRYLHRQSYARQASARGTSGALALVQLSELPVHQWAVTMAGMQRDLPILAGRARRHGSGTGVSAIRRSGCFLSAQEPIGRCRRWLAAGESHICRTDQAAGSQTEISRRGAGRSSA